MGVQTLPDSSRLFPDSFVSTEITIRSYHPNRNKLRSNPVTGDLMQPEQATQGEYRVITHPRPQAVIQSIQCFLIDLYQVTESDWVYILFI